MSAAYYTILAVLICLKYIHGHPENFEYIQSIDEQIQELTDDVDESLEELEDAVLDVRQDVKKSKSVLERRMKKALRDAKIGWEAKLTNEIVPLVLPELVTNAVYDLLRGNNLMKTITEVYESEISRLKHGFHTVKGQMLKLQRDMSKAFEENDSIKKMMSKMNRNLEIYRNESRDCRCGYSADKASSTVSSKVSPSMVSPATTTVSSNVSTASSTVSPAASSVFSTESMTSQATSTASSKLSPATTNVFSVVSLMSPATSTTASAMPSAASSMMSPATSTVSPATSFSTTVMETERPANLNHDSATDSSNATNIGIEWEATGFILVPFLSSTNISFLTLPILGKYDWGMDYGIYPLALKHVMSVAYVSTRRMLLLSTIHPDRILSSPLYQSKYSVIKDGFPASGMAVDEGRQLVFLTHWRWKSVYRMEIDGQGCTLLTRIKTRYGALNSVAIDTAKGRIYTCDNVNIYAVSYKGGQPFVVLMISGSFLSALAFDPVPGILYYGHGGGVMKYLIGNDTKYEINNWQFSPQTFQLHKKFADTLILSSSDGGIVEIIYLDTKASYHLPEPKTWGGHLVCLIHVS